MRPIAHLLAYLLEEFGKGLKSLPVDIVLSVAGSLIAAYKANDWLTTFIDGLGIRLDIKLTLVYPVALITYIIFTAFLCFLVLRMTASIFIGSAESIEHVLSKRKSLKRAKLTAVLSDPIPGTPNNNFLRCSLTIKNLEAIDMEKVYVELAHVSLVSKYKWGMDEKDVQKMHGLVHPRLEWEIGDSEKTGYTFIPANGSAAVKVFEINSGRNEFSLELASHRSTFPSLGAGLYSMIFEVGGQMPNRYVQRDLIINVDYRDGKNFIATVQSFK